MADDSIEHSHVPRASVATLPHSRSIPSSAAHRALLNAKAVLRGEQSPRPAVAHGDTLRPSLAECGNCHGEQHHRHELSLSPSPLPRLHSDTHRASSSNGATASLRRSSSGSSSRPTAVVSYDISSGVASPSRETRSPSASLPRGPPPSQLAAHPLYGPDAASPVLRTAEMTAGDDRLQRRSLRVRFADEAVPAAATAAAARSASPLPVPPPPHGSAFPSGRAVSEVDARTVQLLQCLTYAEIQQVHKALANEEAAAHRAGLWHFNSTRGWTDDAGVLPNEWVEEEPPVLLDVDAHLRYSALFSAHLSCSDDDADAQPTQPCRDTVHVSNAHDEMQRNWAAPPSAGETTFSSLPQRTQAASWQPSSVAATAAAYSNPTASIESDEELTLSPIVDTSVTPPTPFRHRHEAHTQPLCRTTPPRVVRHVDTHAAPTSVPSILISPQKEQQQHPSPETTPTSAPRRPRIVVLATQQQQQRVLHTAPITSTSSSPAAAASPCVAAASPYTSTAPAPSTWSLTDFDIGRRVGCGMTGKTYLVREKRSKTVVALKCVAKARTSTGDAKAATERAIRLQMSAGRHCPQVLKLYAFFEDTRRVYLTLEYAEDGDVGSYAARQPHRRLAEAEVQRVAYHVALALRYLHESGVVHGAVAPNHVLLRNKGSAVKLGHFLKAARLSPDGETEEQRAAAALMEDGAEGQRSMDYAAPEVLRGHGRSSKSDMWALGVMAYELLCGYLPFEHVSLAHMKQCICKGVVFYPRGISATAKSFIGALLCVEEAGRCNATEALEHPFLRTVAAVAAAPLKSRGDADTAAAVVNPEEKRGEECVSLPPASHASPSVCREAATATTAPPPPPPVRRDLSATFSRAAADDGANADLRETHDKDTWSAVLDQSIAMNAASTSPFTPLANVLSPPQPDESFATSSNWSSRCDGANSGANSGGQGHASSSSAPPSTSTTLSLVLPASPTPTSPFSFSNFALPSHPWQGGEGKGSQCVHGSTTSLSFLISRDEAAGPRLQRRSSATSVKSAGNGPSSRHSLTMTLSDVSASLLSTTCAPAGALGVLIPADAQSSSSKSSGHHHQHLQQGQPPSPGVHCKPFQFLCGDAADVRATCSVSVSSLTATSPRHDGRGGEWPSELDVDVSATSSTASPPSVHLGHRHSLPSPFIVAGASRQLTVAVPAWGKAWQKPRVTPDLSASLATSTDTRTNAAAAATSKGSAMATKQPSGPECATRLDFDTLSDEDG